jgi:asparagine synthetase B (glutamine-hydrolysing)
MENSAVAERQAKASEFCPPRWLFSLENNGEALMDYSRLDLDGVSGQRAALFAREGEQGPRVARSGHLAVVFDGELYDPGKLAEEAGIAEAPADEAMLLLRCYESRGQSFFPKLRGMFVLIVWDARRGDLFCVRDPLGYYPCFFASSGRNVLISTSARVLLDHPSVSRAVNRFVLLDYFFDIWARREETFFEGIRRVSPGHALRAAKGELTIYRYWNPLPVGDSRRMVGADELGQFESLLARSVNRSLAQGPVGIFLSGGLDSVSVAALASQGCHAFGVDPPHALSLVFPYPEYDESAIQKSVARQLGLTQDLVPLETVSGPNGLFGDIEPLSPAFSSPIQNIWLPAYSRLTTLAKQRGLRTILTGTGGDEWLGVTPLLAADLIRTGHFREVGSLWASVGRFYPVSRAKLGWNLIWVYGFRALLRGGVGRALSNSAPGLLRAATRTRRAKKKPTWMKIEPRLWREFQSRLEESDTDFKPLDDAYGFYFGDILRGLDHPLISMEFEENFENALRLGVPLSHPYLDADLIEMLCAVPPALLLAGGSKGPVRQMLRQRFPELGFEGQKKISVFRALPTSVLGDAWSLWERSGKGKALGELGLTDTARLDGHLGSVLKSGSYLERYLGWRIMAAEQWLRNQIHASSVSKTFVYR